MSGNFQKVKVERSDQSQLIPLSTTNMSYQSELFYSVYNPGGNLNNYCDPEAFDSEKVLNPGFYQNCANFKGYFNYFQMANNNYTCENLTPLHPQSNECRSDSSPQADSINNNMSSCRKDQNIFSDKHLLFDQWLDNHSTLSKVKYNSKADARRYLNPKVAANSLTGDAKEGRWKGLCY